MWALGLSNKIPFSESKPLAAQKGPLKQLGLAGCDTEPLSWPTWTKSSPGGHQSVLGRALLFKHAMVEPGASSVFADLFILPHHSQAASPHLLSFKKSLKSTGLKLPAHLTSHKSCCFSCCARVQTNISCKIIQSLWNPARPFGF